MSNNYINLPVLGGGGGSSPLTTKGDLYGYSTTDARVAVGADGTVLTADSANPLGVSWQTPGASGSIVVSGSTASPIAVVAAAGVIPVVGVQQQTIYITGSGGPITVSANPQIVPGTAVGQRLRLVGSSNTNTVTLNDGNGLSLNGSRTLGQYFVLDLDWGGTVWGEAGYSERA